MQRRVAKKWQHNHVCEITKFQILCKKSQKRERENANANKSDKSRASKKFEYCMFISIVRNCDSMQCHDNRKQLYRFIIKVFHIHDETRKSNIRSSAKLRLHKLCNFWYRATRRAGINVTFTYGQLRWLSAWERGTNE